MSDQDEPDRLSYEWHAKRYETKAKAWEDACELCGEEAEDSWHEKILKFRDLVAKLRQAAKDRTELEVLRNYARDGDGMQCEYCDTVCIDGVDDSEDWGTDHDEDERIRLCYRCSEKEHLKHTKEKTDEE